jgi:hypothetical protein
MKRFDKLNAFAASHGSPQLHLLESHLLSYAAQQL